MKIVNRGYLLVKPTSAYIKWANSLEEELLLDAETAEGNIYLIEEDFLEEEPILEKAFKKILENEFSCITEQEDEWPGKLTMELFKKHFTHSFGSTVFDLQKTDLLRD